MRKTAPLGCGLSFFYSLLPILFSYFEISLRMLANGANVGSLFADYKVSAVAGLPHNLLALLEYLLQFNI